MGIRATGVVVEGDYICGMKSTLERLTRYGIIVESLRDGRYMTPDELIDCVRSRCEWRGYGFSADRSAAMKLLQRDFANIRTLMGVDIKCDRIKGYYINEFKDENAEAAYRYEKLISDYDLLTAINPDSELSRYVFAERHRPAGSVNIYPILQAIKNRHSIEFDYTLVRYDGAVKHYRIDPHFLKEDQQRWYVIGTHEGRFKVFGIDRIENLVIDDEDTFKRDESFDPRSAFDSCYGIWNDPSVPIEEIELSYDALDGSFLKRVPLHPSQTVLVDTPAEFRIRLNLRISNDFVMALLSRSRSLTVIKPQSLRDRIHDVCVGAAKRNAPDCSAE